MLSNNAKQYCPRMFSTRYMHIYIRKPLMGIFKKGRVNTKPDRREVTRWKRKRKSLKKEKKLKAKEKAKAKSSSSQTLRAISMSFSDKFSSKRNIGTLESNMLIGGDATIKA